MGTFPRAQVGSEAPTSLHRHAGALPGLPSHPCLPCRPLEGRSWPCWCERNGRNEAKACHDRRPCQGRQQMLEKRGKDRRRPRRRLHNKAFPIKRTSTYLSRSAQIILLSFCTIATPEVASSSFLLLKTCYFMRLLATVPLENHRGNSLIVWPLERSIATSPLTCHGQTPLWIASSQLAPTLSFL